MQIIFRSVLGFAIISYFINAIPLVVDFHPPFFSNDWASYHDVIWDLVKGVWPALDHRPPGYPLFAGIVLLMFGSTLAVVFAHHGLFLLALVYANLQAYRLSAGLGVGTAVASLIICLKNAVVFHNHIMGADQLYGIALVFLFGLFLRTLRYQTPRSFVPLSVVAGVLPLIKPAGHWAVVFILLFSLLFLLTRKEKLVHVSLIAPMGVILSIFMIYNYVVSGVFTSSSFGGVNLAGATYFYWTPPEDAPDKVRNKIEAARNSADSRLVKALRRSSSPKEMGNIFNKLYGAWSNPAVADVIRMDTAANESDANSHTEERDSQSNNKAATVRRNNQILQELAFSAIQDEPELYAKTVVGTLYRLFIRKSGDEFSFRILENMHIKWQSYNSRYRERCDRHPQLAPIAGYCGTFPKDVAMQVSKLDREEPETFPPATRLVYVINTQFFQVLSDLRFLGVMFVIPLFLGAAAMLDRRTREQAGCVVIMCLGVFGSGLIVALVESGIRKYAIPTMYISMLSIPLAIFLIQRWRVAISQRPEEASGRRPGADE